MKSLNILKNAAIAVVLCAFAVGASAQKKVTNISTKSAKACKEYLSVNPLDTIVNVVDVKKEGKKITAVKRSVFLKEGQLTVRVDPLRFEVTTTGAIPYADQEAFLRGEKTIVAPHHENLEGEPRHKLSVFALGGMHFLNGEVVPSVIARFGYEACYLLTELEAVLSRAKYPEQAEVLGHYMTFSANGNIGVKFWQDKLYRSYLAILGTVGYGYDKTDHDDAQFMSKNYGLNWGFMLRGSWSITRQLRVVVEPGYKVTPKVLSGTQEIGNGGWFLNGGLSIFFSLD